MPLSKEKRITGKLLYSQDDMNKMFKWQLSKYNWVKKLKPDTADLTKSPDMQKQEIEAQGELAIRSYNQTDFVKYRVALEIQFGKYAFAAYDIFLRHLAFYTGNHIDLGIEILQMKKLQSQMSSGISYYEGELYNVLRQGRDVPAVPLVIIGIEA